MNPHWFREAPRSRLMYLLTHLPARPLLCLNVGNIGGGFSSHGKIQQHIEAQGGIVVGCDVNVTAALKEGYLRQVIGDVLGLPFADSSFDMVYAGEVLEHLWTPLIALQEVRRVLKPGGTLLLDTPHVYAVGRLVRWILLGRNSIGDPDHKLFYTPAVLVNLLTQSGFEVQDMCTDRKWRVGRWRPPWVPCGRRLGSHLLVKAVRI